MPRRHVKTSMANTTVRSSITFTVIPSIGKARVTMPPFKTQIKNSIETNILATPNMYWKMVPEENTPTMTKIMNVAMNMLVSGSYQGKKG